MASGARGERGARRRPVGSVRTRRVPRLLPVAPGSAPLLLVLLSAAALGGGVQAQPLVNNMPCETMACPVGYQLRWDAAGTRCADGACGVNDTDTCCTLGKFFSHSWRVLAVSNVSEEWEVRRVRFFLDDSCDLGSEAVTAVGVHSSYNGWPNGIAFSHNHGHGGVANRAFAVDPAPSPRVPFPQRQLWSSGAPCDDEMCFIGFKWETDVNRWPLGECHNRLVEGCASESLVKKAGFLRIGCAAVEQSLQEGRYAESLRLQLLEADTFVPDLATFNTTTKLADYARVDLWRTVAIATGLVGGMAYLQIIDTPLSNNTVV